MGWTTTHDDQWTSSRRGDILSVSRWTTNGTGTKHLSCLTNLSVERDEQSIEDFLFQHTHAHAHTQNKKQKNNQQQKNKSQHQWRKKISFKDILCFIYAENWGLEGTVYHLEVCRQQAESSRCSYYSIMLRKKYRKTSKRNMAPLFPVDGSREQREFYCALLSARNVTSAQDVRQLNLKVAYELPDFPKPRKVQCFQVSFHTNLPLVPSTSPIS